MMCRARRASCRQESDHGRFRSGSRLPPSAVALDRMEGILPGAARDARRVGSLAEVARGPMRLTWAAMLP